MSINQLIAQGFRFPSSGGQGGGGYANAMASMRNADLQNRMRMEQLAFERQKFDQENAMAQQVAMMGQEQALAAAMYQPGESNDVSQLAAFGKPGEARLNALFKQQEYKTKQDQLGFDREKLNAELPGMAATARGTGATAAEKELQTKRAIEDQAVNNVLSMPDKNMAFDALKQLTVDKSISEARARVIAAQIGKAPSIEAVREQFARLALTPQQQLEQELKSTDLGGRVQQTTYNKYGMAEPVTTELQKTMTPGEVSTASREHTKQMFNMMDDNRKFELEKAKTQSQVAKDSTQRAEAQAKLDELQREQAESSKIQSIVDQTGFDPNNAEDRNLLLGSEQGRKVLKSFDDLQTSSMTRQLKEQELTQKVTEGFVNKLGIATTQDSLAALFNSAFQDPEMSKHLKEGGLDTQNTMEIIKKLDSPEKVKEFVRQLQGQFTSEKEKLAKETNDITNYKYARDNGYKGSFTEYQQMGETVKDGLTGDIKEYEYARGQGYKGSFEEWRLSGKKAGATNVSQTVSTSQEKKFEEGLGTLQAKQIEKQQENALAAAEVIETGNIGKRLLEEGAMVGFGAEFLTKTGEALHRIGFNVGSDAVANTRAYAATMGKSVASLIKQFGAGTGLSDADREFATLMAGGNIALDAKSLRRIIEINDRASRRVIRKYNDSVKGIKSVTPLTVDEPPEYKVKKSAAPPAPSTPAVGTVKGGYKFKGGDPANPSSWEKQ